MSTHLWIGPEHSEQLRGQQRLTDFDDVFTFLGCLLDLPSQEKTTCRCNLYNKQYLLHVFTVTVFTSFCNTHYLG